METEKPEVLPIGVHDLRILPVAGHWEVYINGEFFCSADSHIEAVREITAEYGK